MPTKCESCFWVQDRTATDKKIICQGCAESKRVEQALSSLAREKYGIIWQSKKTADEGEKVDNQKKDA